MESNFAFSFADEYTQLLTELHEYYCRDQPEDILQYCASFFNRKLEEQRATFRQRGTGVDQGEEYHPLAENNTSVFAQKDLEYNQEEDEEEDDFDDEERDNFSTAPLSMAPPSSYNRGRRTSVSAESIVPSTKHDYVTPIIPKTSDQLERIKKSVGNNFLFRNLDEEQHQDVVNAMAEKHIQKGETVIKQGGVGDYFYVVESGTFDCVKTVGGSPPTKVAHYEAGGSFGELALMYNAPRAATIVALSDAVLWALDRVTFRTILMENTSRKRRLYESFLGEVILLKSLEPHERHKIADALESIYFEDGQQVVVQGDVGDQFYIIESGAAAVYKVESDGVRQEVNHLGRGSYFGGKAFWTLLPGKKN
ncbi:hypothetical protein DFQ28_004778 [Apophysomyces sp. BC1034]|nr:hypothetical protein DFQ29_003800 [Apophysomyces sp. BC1021]KAG0188488.1 hypothetical protein DFQ28_004778 [Apophysomyces sp. BC1034]